MKSETSVMKKTVHASFKKVISFDLLFLGLGMPIGAGILALILAISDFTFFYIVKLFNEIRNLLFFVF